MKIQCEQCKIEYNIDDAAIGDRGIRAQCPRCNFITTIRKSQPAILDQARAKLDTAICVNCGKPTEPVPGDPIPICPACQAQSIDVGQKTNVAGAPPPARPAGATPTPMGMGMTPTPGGMGPGIQVPPIGAPPPRANGGTPPPPSFGAEAAPADPQQWRIKKSPNGEVYGPFDRDLIQGWIEGEKIVPSDEISRVGGPWRPASEHEDFAALFAARYGALKANGGGAPALSDAPPIMPETRKTIGPTTGGRIVSPKVQPSKPLPIKAIAGAGAGFAALVVVIAIWYTGAIAALGESFRREPPEPPPDMTDKMIDGVRQQYPAVSGTVAEHLAAGHAAAAADTVEAWTAARGEFIQALAIERKNAEALASVAEMDALLALYDQQTSLLQEALNFSQRAREWDPASVPAARARVAALLASGTASATEARGILESVVLPAAPEDPIALAMLARTYAQSDAQKAEELLKKSVEKSGDLLRPRLELGLLYESLHRYQRALEAFRPILDKSFLAGYRTGKVDEMVGAYREAAAAYKLAAQVAEPTGGRPWVDALVSYAVVQYQALGNPKEASAALAPLEKKFLAPGATETLRSDQANRLRLHLAILARLTGQNDRAMELSRAILTDPNRPVEYGAAASFNLGLAALRKGDFATADKALDEADVPTLARREKSEILYWHGAVKLKRGEIQPAEAAFEESRKEDEQNWRAVVAYATLLGESGERDIEAMAKMEELGQVDPAFYEQYQRITLFHPDPPNELLAQAQRVFARIHTTSHGTDARSSTAQGILAYLSGNRAKASQFVGAALNEAAPDPAAFVFAGLLAEAKGGKPGLDQAIDRFTTAKSDSPSAFLSTAIGRVEAQRGNYQKAISDLQDALNRDPDYAPAHYWMGVVYQKKGDTRQALGKWGDALKYDSNYVRAARSMFDLDRPAS